MRHNYLMLITFIVMGFTLGIAADASAFADGLAYATLSFGSFVYALHYVERILTGKRG